MFLKRNKNRANIYVAYRPIGYKKDLNNKNRLIIDENVSDIVKKIFDMYVNGIGSKLIVKYLNDNHILSPFGYRKTSIVKDKNTNFKWNATTLSNILKNEVYIGNTIQNKVSVVSYKVKKVRKVEQEKYIRVNNTHEAIIDKDIFEKVQIMHKKRSKKVIKQYDYLLRGLIYCKHCGYQMQIVLKTSQNSNRNKIPYIVDTDYKKRNCYARNLNYYKFENQIIEMIKNICKIYANKSMLEATYKEIINRKIYSLSSLKNQIGIIETKIIENNKILDNLYDDKLRRNIIRIRFYKDF